MNRAPGRPTSSHSNTIDIRPHQVPEKTIRHYMNMGINNRNSCIQAAIQFYKDNGYFIDDLHGKLRVFNHKKDYYKTNFNYYKSKLENINREIKEIERSIE